MPIIAHWITLTDLVPTIITQRITLTDRVPIIAHWITLTDLVPTIITQRITLTDRVPIIAHWIILTDLVPIVTQCIITNAAARDEHWSFICCGGRSSLKLQSSREKRRKQFHASVAWEIVGGKNHLF